MIVRVIEFAPRVDRSARVLLSFDPIPSELLAHRNVSPQKESTSRCALRRGKFSALLDAK